MARKKPSGRARVTHTAQVVGCLGINHSIVQDQAGSENFCVSKGTVVWHKCFNPEAVKAFSTALNDTMTTMEAARYLGVVFQTMVNWSIKGKLPAIEGTFGKQRRFDRRTVEAFAAAADVNNNTEVMTTEVLSAMEAAYCVGVSYSTFLKWVKKQIVPVKMITAAGLRRFDRKTMEEIAVARANAVSTGEAAIIVGVSPQTIVNWSNTGKLPCIKWTHSGHRRFDRGLVEQLAEARITEEINM